MAERDSGQPESAEGPGTPGREVGATSFLQRAVIRRRVRFLHRRRELALYDLGGFLFESHRMGQPHEEILGEKLEALTMLDDELAVLQRALDLHEEVAVLSEPGIAACSHCGTLRDSAANFCPGCGRPAAETLTLIVAPPEAAADEEDEVVLAVAPEPAADLSAGPETEIAAAPAPEPPTPLSPDVTTEMPAVHALTWQDAAADTEGPQQPPEHGALAGAEDDERAEDAERDASFAEKPAPETYLGAAPADEPARELPDGEEHAEGTSPAAADAP
jgi:hypothetical protein